jgi:membrane protein required for colicin V production
MNFLDIAILVVLAAFLVKGIWRGLLRELCAFVGLLTGAFLAIRFGRSLGALTAETLHLSPKVSAVLAYVTLFLATVIFFAVLGSVLSRFVQLIFLGGLNRVAGGFFGLAEGVLLLALVLFGASAAGLPPTAAGVFQKSRLAPPFVHLGEATFTGSRHLLSS